MAVYALDQNRMTIHEKLSRCDVHIPKADVQRIDFSKGFSVERIYCHKIQLRSFRSPRFDRRQRSSFAEQS